MISDSIHKTVSAERLKSFVTNRGPKVTMLRVLPSYTVKGKAVIRLNVETDEYGDAVLQDGFWPKGITCMPWRSVDSRRKRHMDAPRNRADFWDNSDDLDEYVYRPYNNYRYNMYDNLDSEVQ